MKLMTVIEATRNVDLLHRIIRWELEKPLAQLLNEPEIRSTFEELYENHLKAIEMMRERARLTDGVIVYDISDKSFDAQNKFIPYYLFPEAVYCVGVSRSSVRAKVSVGSNPWSPRGENRESRKTRPNTMAGEGTPLLCCDLLQARCTRGGAGCCARDRAEAASLVEKGLRSIQRDRESGLRFSSDLLDTACRYFLQRVRSQHHHLRVDDACRWVGQ
jgi:hypothetical protein